MGCMRAPWRNGSQQAPGRACARAAGNHFVKQRLPQMRTSLFDERDVCEPMPAEPITEAGHEFEPARASTDDDDDTMKVAAGSACQHLMVRDRTRHRSSLRPTEVNIPSIVRTAMLE